MIMTPDYSLVARTAFLFVISNVTNDCPICNAELFARGWRPRVLIDGEGEKIILMPRRLMCSKCKRIHHELPDCIVPYKRHCAGTIEAIVDGKPEETLCLVACSASCSALHPGEEGTARRVAKWWRIMLPYLLNIFKSLSGKYKIRYRTMPVFTELVRAVVNSNNWTFPNLICTRSACMS